MATTRLQRQVSGKTLDEATRERRHQTRLDALEQDNHHDDPHTQMKVTKKPKAKVIEHDSTTTESSYDSTDSDDSADSDKPRRQSRRKTRSKKIKRRKKRSPSAGYVAPNHRQDINTLIRIQNRDDPVGPNYVTAVAGPSKYPDRNFCSVCGFPCGYKCSTCGGKYCSLKCLDTHKATRCMKFLA